MNKKSKKFHIMKSRSSNKSEDKTFKLFPVIKFKYLKFVYD